MSASTKKSANDVVVFPGSFDPLTKGHIDLVERALNFFDVVVVGVLSNSKKSTLFSLDERVELIKKALADHGERVRVEAFSGLLVDFAHRIGTRTILRGLRAISDFDYEAQMALMNRSLAADLETFFLMSREEFSYISSSLVREVALLGGDISKFVSPIIGEGVRSKVQQIKRNAC